MTRASDRTAMQTTEANQLVDQLTCGEITEITNVSFRTRQPPNSQFSIAVTSEIDIGTFESMDGDDLDFCRPIPLTDRGCEVYPRATINGSASTGEPKCVGDTFEKTKSWSLSPTSPSDPGTYTVSIEMIGSGSGQVLASTSEQLVVESEDDAPPEEDDPDDPGEPIELSASAILVLLLILLLVYILIKR